MSTSFKSFVYTCDISPELIYLSLEPLYANNTFFIYSFNEGLDGW